MKTYLIHEDNLERLNKKIQTIKNKCIKNNLSFTYNILGSTFKTIETEDGCVHTAKYYEVEVEGSLKHEGWRFAATVEHHSDAGNVIRAYDTELTIPERFRTCGSECEHCHKIRSRKDTYVIYNEETQEFKQVGKQCMQEYTNGLDAEEAVRFVSLFDEAIRGFAAGPSCKHYMNVNEVLRFASECINHFGYEKIYDDEWGSRHKKTTRERVSDYIALKHGNIRTEATRKCIQNEMDEVGFNEDSEFAVKRAEEIVAWLKEEDDDNGYISNLKVITSEDYAETRDFGILVSAPTAYNRHIGYVKEKNEKAIAYAAKMEKERQSQYVGEIKDKISVEAADFTCVTTLYSQYGETYLYKWSDENGNIFIWYASNPVQNPEIVIEVSGTIKDHSEYNGVKQTVMTRCKVVCKEEEKKEKPVSEDLVTSNFLDELFGMEE